jgi:DHA2 family multidrug resistance protein
VSFASAVAAREAMPLNRPMVTLSIMVATIMVVLDTTIANVALPHMQGSLSASQDQVTWILTSYIVASAIMTPLTGWLAGRMGRKNLFLVSIAGFTLASALCGLATSIEEIVLFRLLQGVFGATMMPMSQAVLLDINPREKHGQAMAIYGMGVMVGPIMGPVVGGWLTEVYSWRWCFYINVPIGLAAMAGIFLFIHSDKQDEHTKLDMPGFLLLGLGLGALQMMLDRGQGQDWFNSTEIWVEGALALLGFWWLTVHTLTTEQPFLNRALFKDRNFMAALVLNFFLGVMVYSTTALLPPLMQRLMGYPALQSGMVMAPRGFGTIFAMLVLGRIIGRVDSRLLVMTGFCINALSLWMLTRLSLDTNATPIMIAGVVQGVGMGMIWVPLSTVAFATLAPYLRTDGSSISTLVRNIGSAVGISIINAVQLNNTSVARSTLVERIRPDNPALQGLPSQFNPNTTAGLATLDGEVTRQASMIAYIDAFYLTAILCVLCIPLLLLLRSPRRNPSQPEEAAPHAVME